MASTWPDVIDEATAAGLSEIARLRSSEELRRRFMGTDSEMVESVILVAAPIIWRAALEHMANAEALALQAEQ